MFLNVHSYYSLRYGTMRPIDVLSLAKSMDVSVFPITDINSTSACLDVVRLAPEYGIRPIIGVDFRNGAEQMHIILSKNNNGFENINNYLSKFLHKKEYTIPNQAEYLEDTFVIYPFAEYKSSELQEHEYLGVTISDLRRLKFSPWKKRLDKLVVLHTVSFRHKKDFNTHRLLRAIDNNTLLSKLHIQEQGQLHHQMIPLDELKDAFSEFPEILRNTQSILDSCSIDFDFSQTAPNNQRSYTTSESLDYRLLRKLTFDGLPYRYQDSGKDILARIDKELAIIKEKGFVSYFLINWKILKYARSKGYFYVGRGSGANSIIAYLLRITGTRPLF